MSATAKDPVMDPVMDPARGKAMGPQGRRRGRGARERILATATRLFRDQGINSTGMEQLSADAEVSKRTVYQHFANKDELIAAYLRELNTLPDPDLAAMEEIAPRERVLAVFEQLLTPEATQLCPFVGAAIEIADPEHPARAQVRDYKQTVVARLAEAARDAGADDPDALAEQLALLLDGATVRTRTLGIDAGPTALRMATTLIAQALADPTLS